jgi:hypothetical protein
VQWVNALRGNLQPLAHGVHVNQLGEARRRPCPGSLGIELCSPNYARLAEIKKKYDPKMRFRLTRTFNRIAPRTD